MQDADQTKLRSRHNDISFCSGAPGNDTVLIRLMSQARDAGPFYSLMDASTFKLAVGGFYA
jgi:hypothetical protein